RVAHRCSRLASADHLTLHSLPARRSSDLGRARLKPAVFTFATLLPTTSMIAWLWIMPLAAALRMLGMGLPSEAGELRCRLVEGAVERGEHRLVGLVGAVDGEHAGHFFDQAGVRALEIALPNATGNRDASCRGVDELEVGLTGALQLRRGEVDHLE